MGYRVSGEDVKAIIDTNLTAEQIEASFINPAEILVTRNLTDLVSRGLYTEELDTNTLREIEKWLSAHFISVRDPALLQETIGDATNRYLLPKTSGKGLEASTYGQQALALDPTGLLAQAFQERATIKMYGPTYGTAWGSTE